MKNEFEKENMLNSSGEFELDSSVSSTTSAVAQYRFMVLLFIMILFIITAYVVMRFLGFYDSDRVPSGKHENPIFTNNNGLQSDIPEIPGKKVYDVRNDIDELEKDAPKRDEQFYENINQMEQNGSNSDELKMLKQRDQFAAEKLEYLKKIEKAKTKEERQSLINQLREMMTDDNDNNKQSQQ